MKRRPALQVGTLKSNAVFFTLLFTFICYYYFQGCRVGVLVSFCWMEPELESMYWKCVELEPVVIYKIWLNVALKQGCGVGSRSWNRRFSKFLLSEVGIWVGALERFRVGVRVDFIYNLLHSHCCFLIIICSLSFSVLTSEPFFSRAWLKRGFDRG